MTQADVSAPAMAADGQPVTVPLFSAGSRKEPVTVVTTVRMDSQSGWRAEECEAVQSAVPPTSGLSRG